jgi:cytochrome c-type biogenesis protein CcmH/NrfG
MIMINKIEHLIKARRHQEAIALCRDELARKPDEPRVLYLLAIAYYEGEEYAEAIEALKQITEVHPNDIDALLLMAHISSWGYGDGYPRAVELYHRVLKLGDREVDAYIGLALMRRSPGVQISVEESIKLLERALAIDPSRPEIYNNLAYAYWEAGKYQEARKHFEKLFEISDPPTRPVIEKELRAVSRRQRPQKIVYLGPSLSLLNE